MEHERYRAGRDRGADRPVPQDARRRRRPSRRDVADRRRRPPRAGSRQRADRAARRTGGAGVARDRGSRPGPSARAPADLAQLRGDCADRRRRRIRHACGRPTRRPEFADADAADRSRRARAGLARRARRRGPGVAQHRQDVRFDECVLHRGLLRRLVHGPDSRSAGDRRHRRRRRGFARRGAHRRAPRAGVDRRHLPGRARRQGRPRRHARGESDPRGAAQRADREPGEDRAGEARRPAGRRRRRPDRAPCVRQRDRNGGRRRGRGRDGGGGDVSRAAGAARLGQHPRRPHLRRRDQRARTVSRWTQRRRPGRAGGARARSGAEGPSGRQAD